MEDVKITFLIFALLSGELAKTEKHLENVSNIFLIFSVFALEASACSKERYKYPCSNYFSISIIQINEFI
jgi:hypothetical protein